MSRPVALSTMYFQRWPDQRDLPGFAAAAAEMGFDGIELGHVVEEAALARLHPGAANVMAVHHPCPAVPGGPGAVDLLSEAADAARDAVAAVERSIATADRYGARVVVLHLGRAGGAAAVRARRLEFEVASRYRAGQAGSARHARAAAELAALADALDGELVDRAADVLAPLLSTAAQRGIGLAVETGYHADEMPRPAGMRRLLARLAGNGLAAWLDTGHVGAQVNQGLVTFDAWLEAVGDAWSGAHVHDIAGLRDHLVPGMGDLDLGALVRSLPREAILTCEIDWYFDADEVRAGRAAMARIAG